MRAINNTAVGLLSCETRKAATGCVGKTVYAADATATSGERQLWCKCKCKILLTLTP
jgi:hypothetical protein